jgi:hypothetical protein
MFLGLLDDRVQWHRSWAEMMRWLEELELKHIEVMRCTKSFETMKSAWITLAKEESRPRYAAFAREQAHIYAQLHEDAARMYAKKAEPRLQVPEANILKAILTFRENELEWLVKMACLPNADTMVNEGDFDGVGDA